MATTLIHMAIAKEYCELNPNENYEDFLLGSNLPDITENKIKTHFGIVDSNMTFNDYAKAKVDLQKVVEFVPLDSSVNRGVFMHLITDYLFYTSKYLRNNSKLLGNITALEMGKLSTNDYDILTEKVFQKYGFSMEDVPDGMKKYVKSSNGNLEIYNENEVFSFIKEVAKLNLEKVRKKILSHDYIFLE